VAKGLRFPGHRISERRTVTNTRGARVLIEPRPWHLRAAVSGSAARGVGRAVGPVAGMRRSVVVTKQAARRAIAIGSWPRNRLRCFSGETLLESNVIATCVESLVIGKSPRSMPEARGAKFAAQTIRLAVHREAHE
jgi:hypothetical protein